MMAVLKGDRAGLRAAAVVAVLMGGWAACGLAQAQQAAPLAAAPAQPEPPASTLAAARDVVVASGMARSFSPMVPDILRQIEPTITRTHPELATDLSAVIKQLQPEFDKDGERMTDIAAHVYARRMNEDELKQTAAFFHTPAGAKYVAVQPAMLDELVVSMQSWTQELTTLMYSRIREEMAKKGHNLM